MSKTTGPDVTLAYNLGWNDALNRAVKECDDHFKRCTNTARRMGLFKVSRAIKGLRRPYES